MWRQRTLDAGLLQVGGVDAFEPRDLLVLVGDQRRPVECGLGDRPAKTGRILEFVGETRCIDEELLRNASTDDAGAADAILLGDHHPRAVAGGYSRRPHAARAGAYDEQVDVARRRRRRHN
jgi:hypothetical protein